jgi:micrococcal nuclease
MYWKYRYRRRHGWLAALLVVLVGLWFLNQRAGWVGGPGQTLARDQPGLYGIDHFIDGDTIAVKMNGHVEKVRFVGVDTPETHKPNTPVQCYGPVAAAFTKATIGSHQVRLVSDSLSTDRDRYGRLLRYVYLPDGTDVNELLIKTGHGFYYPYFPFTKSAQFAADEQAAIAARQGLWSSCHPTPSDDGGYKMDEQA